MSSTQSHGLNTGNRCDEELHLSQSSSQLRPCAFRSVAHQWQWAGSEATLEKHQHPLHWPVSVNFLKTIFHPPRAHPPPSLQMPKKVIKYSTQLPVGMGKHKMHDWSYGIGKVNFTSKRKSQVKHHCVSYRIVPYPKTSLVKLHSKHVMKFVDVAYDHVYKFHDTLRCDISGAALTTYMRIRGWVVRRKTFHKVGSE